MASSSAEEQIVTEEGLCSRTVILNRPRQLNALSKLMISRLQELYLMWEKDDNVKLVVIKGKGRAFCVGGDVANICRMGNAAQFSEVAHYIWEEYIMNYTLGTYKKPQVALLNGIVMGGGAGISIHGRFRVATENTKRNWDCTLILEHLISYQGFQVFLVQSAWQKWNTRDILIQMIAIDCDIHYTNNGEYIGLTGVRLDGAEMLACGLATHFVHSMRLPLLEEALAKVKTSNPNVVHSVIDEFSDKAPVKESSALQRLDIIGKCFSRETVEEIISALEFEAKFVPDQWLKSSIQSLKKASPVSLKITLRSVREGRGQGLHECLVREYRMSCHVVLRKVSSDFYEGCRAILVDKDRNPKWNPEKLEQVTQDMVDHYFSKIGDGLDDLLLPIEQREPTAHSHVPAKL